ncbi:MAG: preprotein translocase subunit SecG [Deltaproteobacteria bacterium]|nr:preprotein translocase subunit SecG [Deltaproteobacteria bacterium]
MTTVIIGIHIIICIALILIVLLQTGKGASMGAAFGGSTQTVFGATGSADFFEKITTAVAVIFMLTSLTLTYTSVKRGAKTIMTPPVTQEEKAFPSGTETPIGDQDQKVDSLPVPEVPSPAGSEGAEQ